MDQNLKTIGVLLVFLTVIILISMMFVMHSKGKSPSIEHFTPDWSKWMLVLIHSKSCPHCLAFVPIFDQIRTKLYTSEKLDTCNLEILDSGTTEASVIAPDVLSKMGSPAYVPYLAIRSPTGEITKYNNGTPTYEKIASWLTSVGPDCSLGSTLY